MTGQQLLSALPKSLSAFLSRPQRISIIEDISNEMPDDGYWVYLKPGYCWDEQGGHTVHEWTARDLMRAWGRISPCICKDCRDCLGRERGMSEAKPETARECAERIATRIRMRWATTSGYDLNRLIAAITAELEKRDREIETLKGHFELLSSEQEGIGDFQEAVRKLVISLSGAPDNLIDGSGTDGGWEEFTLREITQGLNFMQTERDTLKKQLAEAVLRLSQCAETFRLYETMHTAKQTEEGLRKAASNGAYAEGIEQFLARVKGSTTSTTPILERYVITDDGKMRVETPPYPEGSTTGGAIAGVIEK
jgi:hypothetical protein